MSEDSRLKDMAKGDRFVTKLTGRRGKIIRHVETAGATRCFLHDPLEEKNLHPNVVVSRAG